MKVALTKVSVDCKALPSSKLLKRLICFAPKKQRNHVHIFTRFIPNQKVQMYIVGLQGCIHLGDGGQCPTGRVFQHRVGSGIEKIPGSGSGSGTRWALTVYILSLLS